MRAGKCCTCGVIVGKRECEVPVRRVLPFFCCVAAWISPLAAFYARDSLWAVLAGLVLSILVSCLIYRYYPASRTAEMLATSPESPSIDPHATRRIALTFAALLLQFGVLSTLASMAHSATILISCAIVVISFFHQSANQTQSNVRFPKTLSLSMMLGLAIILVAASMTDLLRELWRDDGGQDIAEYAVMLAVILVIVVGTIRLVGSNANNVFSNVASSIH